MVPPEKILPSHRLKSLTNANDRDENILKVFGLFFSSANSWPKGCVYGNSRCFTQILDNFCANLS